MMLICWSIPSGIVLPAWGQERAGIVAGVVLDAESGAPLPGANVFIAHSQRGAATDAGGGFTLRSIPAGSHELVASMIGFETGVQSITVQQADSLFIRFDLPGKVYEQGEVVVRAEQPRDFEQNLKKFKGLFLGMSEHARACKLVNPYVLGFDASEPGAYFRATASEPLVVENRALGYRVTYNLQDFHKDEVDPATDILRYMGQPFFEEMDPRDERERKRWADRRRGAYLGSFRHFLRTMVAGEAEAAGFQVDLIDRLPSGRSRNIGGDTIPADSLITPGYTDYEFQFYSPRYLRVTYQGRFGSPNYLRSNSPVVVNVQGYLNNPYGVTMWGPWGQDRVAEMLPRDYTVPSLSP